MQNFFTITGLWRDSFVVPITEDPFAGRLWIGPGQPESRTEVGKRYYHGGLRNTGVL